MFPNPTAAAVAAAEELNHPFTEGELQRGLATLERWKAAGVDGMVAEFVREAYIYKKQADGKVVRDYVLAPALASMFNCVLQRGYPSAWGVSALVPVPKPKGRPDIMDDYRGIAVSPVLAKLFSIVFLARMDRWAERAGLRAVGQAGFRARRGTADNCFVLRHAIDKAAVQQQPLYCAFIDFSKAYDRVDRQLLWKCLQGAGLHGVALQTLLDMHAVVRMQVRSEGHMGTPFDSEVGVKQGDPLSPLLFGILIDRLEPFLERRCPGAGARLANVVARALLYADDVVMMAHSPAQLCAMLGALHDFCIANSMFVNRNKSEVVVFNKKWHVPSMGALHFPYAGEPLKLSDWYVYLGIKFEDGAPIKQVLHNNIDKARKAMYAMFSKCYNLGLHNAHLQNHLFDALVAPVLSYGCEIWGPEHCGGLCDKGECTGVAEESVHRPFMRQMLGVCKTTPIAAMMRDLRRMPLALHWLAMVVGFWNRACRRGSDDYLAVAMKENVQLAMDQSIGYRNRQRLWAYHFVRCMAGLGMECCTAEGVMMQLKSDEVMEAAQAKWYRHEWGGTMHTLSTAPWAVGSGCAVRSAPATMHSGFKLLTYQRWFADDERGKKERHTYALRSYEMVRVMAQFRLGSHWLNIQQGRFRGLDRSSRVCPACPHAVEDEMHVFSCPLYTELRAKYNITGPDTDTDIGMREYMNSNEPDFPNRLAAFLLSCRKERTAL
jgi:hypothetical protein